MDIRKKRKRFIGAFLFAVLTIAFSQKNAFAVPSIPERQVRDKVASASDDLFTRLASLPGVKIERIDPDSGFAEAFDIRLLQPLDHDRPTGKSFHQRILLSHVDVTRPVVFVTEGYALGWNAVQELSGFLGANQIRVEHRYFGESRPESMKWEYLNVWQAAADHHRIVTLFREIYEGTWISTGWSKGGQTALIFRHFYPDDVDATVAYDAPLNFALEDPRVDAFFETVGTEYCRKRLIQFQRLALENKERLLPLFEAYSDERGYTYSVGLEKALEYVVLEYPFSFWQYHHIDCCKIPDEGAPADSILAHLRRVVSFSSYSDRAMNSAAMFQFTTQLGYYGYVTKNVQDLLSNTEYPNSAYAPQDADLTFDPRPMEALNGWLQEHGHRILYIYGEQDPWAAPGVVITGKADALTMTLKGENHYTFITSFPDEEREKILTTLERWLGTPFRIE